MIYVVNAHTYIEIENSQLVASALALLKTDVVRLTFLGVTSLDFN